MKPKTPWRDACADSLFDVPEALRRWILLDTSMTLELRRCFGTDIAVRVLLQDRGALQASESALLGTQKDRGEVREVVLHDGGQALLAARTVHVSLRFRQQLRLLGQRPLGEWLFDAGVPQREARQFALLGPQSALAPIARQAAGGAIRACWARRSLFRIDGQRLLVTEIFLPAMLGQIVPDSPRKSSEGVA